MVRRMTVPRMFRVRGVDAEGIIRHTRVFQQRPAAVRFANYLHDAGYTVRMESARNIEFKLLGEYV